MVARRSAPAGLVRRARVILLSAAGVDGVAIAARLDLSPDAVSRIRRRFVEAGVDGLRDRHPSKPSSARSRPSRVGRVALVKKVSRAYPDRSLHVVLGNSSTHNTDDVRASLAAHTRIHFHYTPTSGPSRTISSRT